VAGELVSPEKMEGITAFFRDMNAPVEFYLHPALNKELAKKAAVEIEVRQNGASRTDGYEYF